MIWRGRRDKPPGSTSLQSDARSRIAFAYNRSGRHYLFASHRAAAWSDLISSPESITTTLRPDCTRISPAMSQHSGQEPSPSEAVRDEDDRLSTDGPQTPQPPVNHSPTLLFGDLVKHLFERLKQGPPPRITPIRNPKSQRDHRNKVLESFFSLWRKEVGNDVYPAMRLILPHVDKERPMYGLKEQNIAKLLIKLIGLADNARPAMSLLSWKNPGNTAASRMAGDFAGRCFEVLEERSEWKGYGDMRIAEVNELLDRLAAASGQAQQMPIFEEFNQRMCPEELQWLIRIILRQMRIGATEKSVLKAWNPDAFDLFNIHSSLRHTCWYLWDPEIRLDEDDQKLQIMHNFLPQLAPTASNANTWDKVVQQLGISEEKPEFYMEEKLDGERMQMHMQVKDGGGYEFKFWSRKGKDYTYLYGSSLDDNNSALTRHLGGAFDSRLTNCILDGEMIGFDPKKGQMVTFGTLKTAAIHAQSHPHDQERPRPLFRVFDLVYWNHRDFRKQPLWNRRNSLELIIKDVPGRLEIHPYLTCTAPSEIEPYLRKIIQNSSEGIMLKNPSSGYVLNDRPWVWIKVKPDYMKEFGENLDCVIIGGYYGTGRRGGILSSFLCGLRASRQEIEKGTAHPEKFFSFFKVGGGIKQEDYDTIQQLLPEEKWHDWNPKSARQYLELAGGERYLEKPDRWIRPSESIVIEVKAASIEDSNSFSAGKTLRFPRFRSIRADKNWTDALDIDEWNELRYQVKQEENQKKEMQLENNKKRAAKRRKQELTLDGNNDAVTTEKSKLFEGKSFYIPSRSDSCNLDISQLGILVRENGGSVVHHAARVAEGNAIALADRGSHLVQSMLRLEGVEFVISPKWVVDCVKQQCLLPYEDEHLYLAPDDMRALAAENTDQYGDSYCRDLDADEMEKLFALMRENRRSDGIPNFDRNAFYDQLEARGHELPRSTGYVFRRCRVYLAQVEGQENPLTTARLEAWVRFGCGEVADDLDDGVVTHVVVVRLEDEAGAKKVGDEIRTRVSKRKSLKRPYVVTEKWMEKCWEEETLVAEEPYFT